MRAAAILAGGNATRLGGAWKPHVVVAGRTILARQLEVLAPLVDEVLLVTRDGRAPVDPQPQLRMVSDRRPGAGPLAGLEAALAATGAESILLVAGDMPALQPRALALLLDAPPADVVVPRALGHLQVLHARYARRLLPAVTARLDGGQRSLVGLLDGLPGVTILDEAMLRAVDPSLLTLANVNTPEDRERLEHLLVI